MSGEWVPRGWFFECGHMNGCHKNHNGWDLGLVAPVSSIIGTALMAAYLEL